MKVIIKNIAELIQTESNSSKWVAGADMQNLNTIKDAFLEIEDRSEERRVGERV